MTITEKSAYLKGLAEGLNLDESKPESKIIKALLDVIEDLALTVSDLEDELSLVGEQVDAVDEDLDELESYVYDECADDECDCDCCDDDDYFEVECPACHEVISVDEGVLESGGIDCPNCGASLDFEFDEDDEEEESDN